MLMSRLDAYISRYGNFCANDNDNDDNNNDDMTDYFFTPCACAQGNNYYLAHCFHGYNKHVFSPQELYECLPWPSGTV